MNKYKTLLTQLLLNDTNAIVIGSGILDVLGIRDAKDIDITVTKREFERLKQLPQFHQSENHGRKVLVWDNVEVGTEWEVLGSARDFQKLCESSVVIDGVRYVLLEFLLAIKKDWRRLKDPPDIDLIEAYLTGR